MSSGNFCRAVETAAQYNKVLRTAEGAGFNRILDKIEKGIHPCVSLQQPAPYRAVKTAAQYNKVLRTQSEFHSIYVYVDCEGSVFLL
jgi:hypothetical protein